MEEAKDYKKHMDICDQLAIKAGEKGNNPVGCIILEGNRIIARAEEAGQSMQDITCHAEIEAIRKARRKVGIDMSDCTLVSTHEPCVMCGYAIRFHKISRVVYKNKVKSFGSINSAMNILGSTEVPSHWSKPPQIILYKN